MTEHYFQGMIHTSYLNFLDLNRGQGQCFWSLIFSLTDLS